MSPKAPADRVKTDKRDCRRLARLHRAGKLVANRVPTEAEEAVRDLCRARADLVNDRIRTRHRLSKFLLRHDRIWRDTAWTIKHEQWLTGHRFDEAALRSTYGHYRAVVAARDAESAAIEADLAYWHTHGPFAGAVARLAAYRGIAYLGALTIASEVGDWRRQVSGWGVPGWGREPQAGRSGPGARRSAAGNRYDLVLGQSPEVGAGLPYMHVFTNQAGAPKDKIRLSLRNVSGVPEVSILIFGPYTPPALQHVPRGQEGSALLAATFSELNVIPSSGTSTCEAWFMEDFPDKTAVVIYAASPGLPDDQQPCACGAVLRWV